MYPHERSLVKQLADLPFALIGVNSDKDLDHLKERMAEEKITWRSFQDEKGVDGVISEAWAVRGWPTIYILDEKGVIRWTGHGGDIDGEITKLLAEMGHDVKISHDDEEQSESEESKDEKDETADSKGER